MIHPGGPFRPNVVTLTSNPSCWVASRAMMSSWLCHISCDHVWPPGILAGCWPTERPGRNMGIGEANEPEKGKEGTTTRKWNDGGWQEKAGAPVQLPLCRLSGSNSDAPETLFIKYLYTYIYQSQMWLSSCGEGIEEDFDYKNRKLWIQSPILHPPLISHKC